MMHQKPLLSIGMIVKNEIRCLEKCLKALQPLRDAVPCELVIADTGSTDGTRELAVQYADILFDFEWINDFSAARNAVLERCTGEWHLAIDADEYLRPDIQEMIDFLASPDNRRFNFCAVVQRNYSDIELQGTYQDFRAVRMARFDPSLRYEGAIHEVPVSDLENTFYPFATFVLDHDGYATEGEDIMKKKAERNLPMLEAELVNNPSDLLRILQCQESAMCLPSRRSEYARRAMKLVMESAESLEHWDLLAPPIVRQAVNAAITDSLPELEEWVSWARNTFPDSAYVNVDVNYLYAFYLLGKEQYSEVVSIGGEYLEGLRNYRETGWRESKYLSSPIQREHSLYEKAARIFLSTAYRNEGDCHAALSILDEVDLHDVDIPFVTNLLVTFEELYDDTRTAQRVAEVLEPFWADSEKDSYQQDVYYAALNHISACFKLPFDSEVKRWRVYRNMPGTIGICAQLADAQSRKEAEALLGQIDDWTFFMPLALARAMALGAELPEAIYHIPAEQLREIESVLPKCDPNFSKSVMVYTDPDRITDWHRLCFAFELLAAVWMTKDGPAEEERAILAERFAQVGAAFLREYYNPSLLEQEETVDRLPALHRFVWYFTRAVMLRNNGDEVGYICLLRTALKQTGAMKELVDYLVAQVREEQKKQTIADASPELLALAEQVKAILARYPVDDPSVLALKQTPAYQQVAFLIEE